MAYVKVDGKWVTQTSGQAGYIHAADTESPSTAIASEPAIAHVAAEGETQNYDAMPGAHWIIDDFLCVGSFSSAGVVNNRQEEKRQKLLEHGITHIVNCTREFDCLLRSDFEYLQLRAADVTGQNMIAFWPAACDFIEEARTQGGRVLVHCAGGVSRSGSTAVAYLMRRGSLPLSEALAEAQKRRKMLQPNPGFRDQLQVWHHLGFVAPSKGEFALRTAPEMQRLQRLPRAPELVPPEESRTADVAEDLPICIQFCSDMHLELPLETKRFGQHLQEASDFEVSGNVLPRVGQGAYLALLGDVFDGAKIRDGTYREYLLQQSVGYKAVFVLAGNHEFYRAEYGACRASLVALCEDVTDALGGRTAVQFLDCTRVDLPGTDIRVLGCTLWSAVDDDNADEVSKSLSDYSAISVSCGEGLGKRKATVADTNAWHMRELTWLRSELAQAEADGQRCVVMTHHAPTFHGTADPRHGKNAISSAFCTDLEKLLCPPVSAWLFGHTHWSSWQQYRPSPANPAEGKWLTLSDGDSDGRPCDADFVSFGNSDAKKGQVLVASNQLGYGAKGEHRKSRCHPCMALSLSPDGCTTSLRCSPRP